jgi:TolB protein
MIRKTLALLALPAALAGAAPAWATFPGGNGKLVFQRPVGKQMDLFTIRPDGSHVKRLIGGRAFEEKAEWSPDGRRIAFARGAPSGLPAEIWTAGARGGDPRRLTTWNDLAGAPTWTPANRIVYFTTKDFPPQASPDDPLPPSELYSMASDGGDQRRLTTDEVIQVDPAVSPADGTVAYIAYRPVAGEPGVFDLGLFSIAADGSGPKAPAPFSARRDVLNASWSPDGSRIVFEVAWARPRGNTGGSHRQSDLLVMNADGTGLHRLTLTRALETNPVWSPDGRLIAFTSDRHVKRGKRERWGPDFELYVMRANGSRIRRLTHNSVPDLVPDWQPIPR